MKKKILLISSMLVTFILIIFVSLNNTNNENKNVLSNTNKDKQVINNNMITMMYETDAGTGIYEETKDTTWPESGYIFNENLSGCENGGELEYNSINKTVNLLSNKSDRCYVYFDKYDGVWIDNVSVTNVTGSSVTLNVGATSENGSITTYYYALDDNEEYQESTSNIITINDLNKLTEYKIKVYAVDSTNAKSNIYEISATTTDISIPVINSVSASNITTSGFTLTVDATSDVEIERYYFYVNGDGENYAGTSTTPEYTFNTLKDNTNYTIIIFAENNNGIFSNKYSINITTDKIPILLADYIKGLYISQGSNGIYYHTSSLANSAADNSYRYAGASANVNNYVCFGSDASTCPSDNLYRIIGVFGNEVKLIKSTSYGNYYWSGSSSNQSNTWSSSTLNTSTLNGTYLNNLGSAWSNLIATHSWKVGGMSRNNSATAKQYYETEIGSSSSSTTYSAKIGLMYVSDYGFAASNSYWTEALYDYDNSTLRSNNWMYLGSYEWTISRYSDVSYGAFLVVPDGFVNNSIVTGSVGVRPVFYLSSLVNYVSGTGTQSDPFRIA